MSDTTQKIASCTPMCERQHVKIEAQCIFLAKELLNTINLNSENIKECEILDSGATSHFLVANTPSEYVKIATNLLTVRQPDSAQV